VKKYITSYLEKLVSKINEIDVDTVVTIINHFIEASRNGSSIYVIGNGGSAATASHIANDFSGGLKLRGIENFNVVSLASNVPLLTAIANDVGYENIFYAQIFQKIKSSDILFAISCSGNSPNIIKAAKYANLVGTKVIGLTGFDGGELKEISNVNYHVSTDRGEYGLVEDLHMILDHIMYSYFISMNPDVKSKYIVK
jgi:D-sedoheptulose 7-phosphate isomerase